MYVQLASRAVVKESKRNLEESNLVLLANTRDIRSKNSSQSGELCYEIRLIFAAL